MRIFLSVLPAVSSCFCNNLYFVASFHFHPPSCSLWSMPRVQDDYRISFVGGPSVCGCLECSVGCCWHGEPCVCCVFLGCYVDGVLVIGLFL